MIHLDLQGKNLIFLLSKFLHFIWIFPVYTNHRSIGKSVTVEFSFKRNFICPQAELISSNYLLKAKEIEMSHVTFKSMTLLYETSTITICTSMPKNAIIKLLLWKNKADPWSGWFVSSGGTRWLRGRFGWGGGWGRSEKRSHPRNRGRRGSFTQEG